MWRNTGTRLLFLLLSSGLSPLAAASPAVSANSDQLVFAIEGERSGRADLDFTGARLKVISPQRGKVSKWLVLADGSTGLNDVRVSPDGKYAVATHLIARSHVPTSQLERGWVIVNAISIIDARQLRVLGAVLLDEPGRGAGNPWGVAWTTNSRTLIVTHAGTHEISVIDFSGLIAKIQSLPIAASSATDTPPDRARTRADVAYDLSFLTGLRQRVKLPPGDLGPREVSIVGDMKGSTHSMVRFRG